MRFKDDVPSRESNDKDIDMDGKRNWKSAKLEARSSTVAGQFGIMTQNTHGIADLSPIF